MKNKLLAVLATLSMVASASAVKVNDNLSINGFIDGSYASSDDGTANGKTQSLEIDEVEINFVTNVGNVSGLIAVDANPNADYVTPSNDTENLGIEQAHFTYNINIDVSKVKAVSRRTTISTTESVKTLRIFTLESEGRTVFTESK